MLNKKEHPNDAKLQSIENKVEDVRTTFVNTHAKKDNCGILVTMIANNILKSWARSQLPSVRFK